MRLEDLGWSDSLESAFRRIEGDALAPARVIALQRDHHRLLGPGGPCSAVLTGRLRHHSSPAQLPVVGDWVAVRRAAAHGTAQIVACLPRRGALVRKLPDRVSGAQVLAANLDTVFLVTSLDQDFSPRRIERALAMIWEGGARPVLLLAKADLCADADALRDRAEAVAIGVDVHVLSARTGQGVDALAPYLQPARTLALVGSTGVGKSTLVNHWLGEERVRTGAVRESDGKGRHTTTGRELFVLPGGALLIDTPGMRELMLWDGDEGVHAVFDDVEALAARCRFADCRHDGEPGCALRAAVEAGALDPQRIDAWAKLRREVEHQGRRRSARAQAQHQHEQRSELRRIARSLRRHPKRDRWSE